MPKTQRRQHLSPRRVLKLPERHRAPRLAGAQRHLRLIHSHTVVLADVLSIDKTRISLQRNDGRFMAGAGRKSSSLFG